MALKARKLAGNNGGSESNIDWKAINDQVEEGTQGGRISLVVDLGMHKEEMALGEKGQTGFVYEEDAEAWLKQMKAKYKGSKAFKDGACPDIQDADEVTIEKNTKTIILNDDGSWEVSEDEPAFIVALNEFGGEREYQELAIFADLTENRVDYGGDIGDKPFRIMLNGQWQGEVKGFPLKKSKPATEGGKWTVKSNSKLAELANATRLKEELLGVDLEEADWSLLAGKALNIPIVKEGDEGQWIKAGRCVALKVKKGKVEEVEDLDSEALVISFDDCTVDILREACLRKSIIDKIKKATDYAGSEIESAILALEAEYKAKAKAKSEDGEGEAPKGKKPKPKPTKPVDNEGDDEGEGDDDDVEVENPKVKPVKKPAKPKPKPTDDEGEGEGEGDGNDWSE